jgi:hypothetical protein
VAVDYPPAWVRTVERPEGWVVTKAFGEWLAGKR